VEFVGQANSLLAKVIQASQNAAEVGDYFLDRIEVDKARRLINLTFNLVELFSQEPDWGRVKRGLHHILTPGYNAKLHASWNGWVDSRVAKHWLKPLYDALWNNRQLVFNETMKNMGRYLAQEFAEEGGTELVTWLAEKLIAGADNPFSDYLGRSAVALGLSYQSELLREREELINLLNTYFITEEKEILYKADIKSRGEANEQIVSQLLELHNFMWANYEKVLEDESKWWKFMYPMFVKWIIVGAAMLAFDGPGYYVASLGMSGILTLYDFVKDTRAIAKDEAMYARALDFFMEGVSHTYKDIGLNTVGALNLIRFGDTPQIAEGEVTVSGLKSFGHYRLWPSIWWAEEDSQIEL